MDNFNAFMQHSSIDVFFPEKHIVAYSKGSKSFLGQTGDFLKYGLFSEDYDEFMRLLMQKRITPRMDFVELSASGTTELYLVKAVEYDDAHLVLLVPVGSLAEDMVDMQRKVERDEMTGLANRRYGMEQLERQTLQVKKLGGICSILLLDIDNFKQVNDTFGHEAGDYVIKNVARLLLGSVRSTDVVARVGGEEFLVILPNTGLSGAETVAGKINSLIARSPCNYREKTEIPQTVSIGVVAMDAMFGGEKEDVLRTVDQALYAAKANGKNKYEALDYILTD